MMKKALFIIAIISAHFVFFQARAQNAKFIEPPSGKKVFKESNLENMVVVEDKNAKVQQKNTQVEDLSDLLLGKNKVSSLMFDEEELSSLDRAVFALENGELYNPENSDENNLSDKNLSLEEKLKLERENKIKEKSENNEKSYIYLASIMYLSKDDWSAWINNSKITSANNNRGNEFFIKKINGEQASIVWTLSPSKWRALTGKSAEAIESKVNEKNQVEVEFTLKINQTFILKLNYIAEGKNVSSAINKSEEKTLKKFKKRVNN